MSFSRPPLSDKSPVVQGDREHTQFLYDLRRALDDIFDQLEQPEPAPPAVPDPVFEGILAEQHPSIGGDVHTHAAYCASTRELYLAASDGNGRLDVYERTGNKWAFKQSITSADGTTGETTSLVYNSLADRVWWFPEGAELLHIIKPDDYSVTSVTLTGYVNLRACQVDESNSRAFVYEKDGDILELDVDDGSVVNTVDAAGDGVNVRGLALDHDNGHTRVYIVGDDGSIHRYDYGLTTLTSPAGLATGVTGLTPGALGLFGAAVLAFLYVYPADGTMFLQIDTTTDTVSVTATSTGIPSADGPPVFDQTNQRIYYATSTYLQAWDYNLVEANRMDWPAGVSDPLHALFIDHEGEGNLWIREAIFCDTDRFLVLR